MTKSVESQLNCPSCYRPNQPGMLYCLYCGNSLSLEQPEGLQKCAQCGRSDQLNDLFCVHCGSKIESSAASQDPIAKLSWELEQLAPIQKQSNLSKPKIAKRGRLNLIPFAALLGIASGLACAWKLLDPQFAAIFLQGNWPKQGLVVYANPPFAQVTIEDAEAKKFSIGQLGSLGSLSLSDLAPGLYRVQIAAPGYQTAVQYAPIEQGRPTVLGFPERINLPVMPSSSLP
jgi:hypothetical protein